MMMNDPIPSHLSDVVRSLTDELLHFSRGSIPVWVVASRIVGDGEFEEERLPIKRIEHNHRAVMIEVGGDFGSKTYNDLVAGVANLKLTALASVSNALGDVLQSPEFKITAREHIRQALIDKCDGAELFAPWVYDFIAERIFLIMTNNDTVKQIETAMEKYATTRK